MCKKCWICEDKEIETVFTNTHGVKHNYCKRCAKKYIVKLPNSGERYLKSKINKGGIENGNKKDFN